MEFSHKVRKEIASWRGTEEGGCSERLFIPALFAIGLAPLPLWVFVRHGSWDGVFWFTFKQVALPIFLVVAVGSRLFMPRFWSTSDWFSRGFTFVMLTAMLTFMAQVHVAAINKWYNDSVPVVISGRVVDKLENGEGAFGVRIEHGRGTADMKTTRAEYDTIKIGSRFAKRYMKGSLGLLYVED